MNTEKIITIIETHLNRVFGRDAHEIVREIAQNNGTEWIEFNVLSKDEEKKLIYAVRLNPEAETASLREHRVPYGSVEQRYRNGMVEQFSPFDDMTTPEPVSETIEEWIEKELKELQ
jgi:hypothetical protein